MAITAAVTASRKAAALHAPGRISVSTLHFDLTDREGLETLRSWDLEAMLAAVGGDGEGNAPLNTGDASR